VLEQTEETTTGNIYGVSSPTSRSLNLLRERGFIVDVVERFIPGVMQRRDLFGFGDLLAIGPRESDGSRQVLIVQTTSSSNAAARVKKIEASEHIAVVREAGVAVHVHGWLKNSKGRWVVREIDCS
jgi:hypothetical protein